MPYKFSMLMVFFFLMSPTHADDLTKVQLSTAQQKEFDSLAQSFHIAACDSISLEKSLEQKPPCRLAEYVAPFAKWLVSKGKTLDECVKDCGARCECMNSARHFKIDLLDVPVAGDRHAPVSIVVYISAMCPLCKYLASEIYREVTTGALQGKARLLAKPFTEGLGDRALVAAGHFNKYWDYIIALNNIKMRPDEPILLRVADSLGMRKAAFNKLLADTSIMKKLVGFREEGEKNEVTVTPTFFIDGKRYRSYKDPQWVVDAALYEYEGLKPGR
ncbi:MAG: thioredoxin domain-containing protein [Chitinivibrionales bacterium]